MSKGIVLSKPNFSDGSPKRYGRDFSSPEAGPGRIEEAPPADMDPTENVVSRVIVRFDDEERETVDTRDVAPEGGSIPTDVSAFRRQIIHEDRMVDVISACIARA